MRAHPSAMTIPSADRLTGHGYQQGDTTGGHAGWRVIKRFIRRKGDRGGYNNRSASQKGQLRKRIYCGRGIKNNCAGYRRRTTAVAREAGQAERSRNIRDEEDKTARGTV